MDVVTRMTHTMSFPLSELEALLWWSSIALLVFVCGAMVVSKGHEDDAE